MSYLGRSAKLSLKAQEKVSFLATAGQTVKTGLSYTPSFVEVYVNGVLLTDTTDFTATNGNSITFTVALLLNDEVTVISLKTFTVADHYTKSDADTLLAAKATVANFTSTGIDDNATSTKVTVSNTGIDVTGRATTDGITSSGTIIFDNGNSSVGIHSDSSDGSYIAYGANEWLRFLYDNGGGETMRMHDSGYVTMPQGVTLGNGNTYAAANTLDDYEEGTWTPSGTGINTGTSVGFYTKVGNVCHTQMWIHANGSTDGTITGLPFTAGSGSSNAIAAGTIAYQNGSVTGILSGGASTTFTLYNGTATGSMASGNQMHCAMTYRTT